MEFFHFPHSPILGDWKGRRVLGSPLQISFEGGIIRVEAHTPGAENVLPWPRRLAGRC